MDPLGSVIRSMLKKTRDIQVRNALALAKMLQKESMRKDQIEEMLFSNNFENDIIMEAMDKLYDS